MSHRVLHPRHLSHRERHVLQLLRAGPAEEIESEIATAFALLLRNCRANDLTVSPLASPVVHQDEKKLLAWITLLQRRRPGSSTEHGVLPAGALLQALQTCARLLETAGCHLNYRAVLRDAAFERPLQSQILRLVTEKGTVAAHDLKALGASSHAINAMRKTGLLRHISQGFCALGRSDPAGCIGDHSAHA